MYKNIEELSRLDTYEYYDDMLMDFKIYEVTNTSSFYINKA